MTKDAEDFGLLEEEANAGPFYPSIDPDGFWNVRDSFTNDFLARVTSYHAAVLAAARRNRNAKDS